MSEITKAVLDMPMDIAVCGHIASVQYWLASQARITQLQADLKASQSDCKRLNGILDAISNMEGEEGMTDYKFAKSTLLIIAHGPPCLEGGEL